MDDVARLLDDGRLREGLAARLLNVYYGPPRNWKNWEEAIASLKGKLRNNNDKIRELISFAIIFPTMNKNNNVDPEAVLFFGNSFYQFSQKDNWLKELQKVVRKDQKIEACRKEIIALGTIDPIEYQPFSRQAYKWLCEAAADSGIEVTQKLKDQFRNLVMIYGGEVISNVFSHHKTTLKNVVNWRSPYFFERIIHDIYTLDQIKRMKQSELNKTNVKWVKQTVA